jgi:hypothetical protein
VVKTLDRFSPGEGATPTSPHASSINRPTWSSLKGSSATFSQSGSATVGQQPRRAARSSIRPSLSRNQFTSELSHSMWSKIENKNQNSLKLMPAVSSPPVQKCCTEMMSVSVPGSRKIVVGQP